MNKRQRKKLVKQVIEACSFKEDAPRAQINAELQAWFEDAEAMKEFKKAVSIAARVPEAMLFGREGKLQ